MFSLKTFVIGAVIASSLVSATESLAAGGRPSRPVSGVIQNPPPVSGETMGQRAAINAWAPMDDRMVEALADLDYAFFDASREMEAAFANGAGDDKFDRIAKKYEKAMKKIVKKANKDLEDLYKAGRISITAANGTAGDLQWFQGRYINALNLIDARFVQRLGHVNTLVNHYQDL